MNTSPLPNDLPDSQPLPTPQPPVQTVLECQHAPDATAFAAVPAGPLQLASHAVISAPDAKLSKRNPINRGHRGKIARLPGVWRDMVNRMLRNNIPYGRIVGALDEHGIKVTERNISNWKTWGGYHEWCLAQDHAAALHVHQDNLLTLLRRDNASEIPEVGLQVAATRLSEFFLTPEADQLLASDPAEYRRRAAHLAQLTAQINNLQKYRDDSSRKASFRYDPERNRRELEAEVEITRNTYSSTISPNARAKDPDTPHHNYLPKEP
jgi:hypothetical protein